MPQKLNWIKGGFLIITPILAIVLSYMHLSEEGFLPVIWLTALAFFFITGMSITGGYHRLFSHKAYEANKLMRLLYALFGAAAFQNSILQWCSDHRQHHRFVDKDKDPYAITKGFWYAHITWMLFDEGKVNKAYVRDLMRDPIVMWQHKYYIPIALTMGLALPVFIGWLLGSAMGGLAIIGFVRVVLVHHKTFLINSVAHCWGSQPYTDTNTARDNLFLAFLTHGEGYHNFHHFFDSDYRNGIRWYQWDPTKWLIKMTSWVGWAKNLHKTPEEEILKAKMKMKTHLAKNRFSQQWESYQPKFEELLQRHEELCLKMKEKRSQIQLVKMDKATVRRWKAEMKAYHLECRTLYKQWLIYTRMLQMA